MENELEGWHLPSPGGQGQYSMCPDLTFQTLVTVANLEAEMGASGLLWCREEVSEADLGGP